MLMYHSALTLFLFWSGVEVTRPDLAKKTAVIWFSIPWISEVGSHLWKAKTEDCCLISGSYLYTKVLLSVTMSQTCSDLPPSNFQACEGTTPPYSSSVPQSAGMAPNGLNASIHQCGDKGSDSSFVMKDSKCSYFTVIHGSSLIRHFAQSGKAIILTKHFAIWKILAITNYEDAVLM